jgi:ADP-heptose:LPS heptosyltransferase
VTENIPDFIHPKYKAAILTVEEWETVANALLARFSVFSVYATIETDKAEQAVARLFANDLKKLSHNLCDQLGLREDFRC